MSTGPWHSAHRRELWNRTLTGSSAATKDWSSLR